VIQNLAQVYLVSNDIEQARELLIEHLDRTPDDIHPRELLAIVYFTARQFKSAISQLLQVHSALERQKADVNWRARVANNIGAAYLGEGAIKSGGALVCTVPTVIRRLRSLSI
jgi:cytochrome c-type biogenesis protein CcmH/NrfG